MENAVGNRDNMRGIKDMTAKELAGGFVCLIIGAVLVLFDKLKLVPVKEIKLSVTAWIVSKKLPIISYTWRAVAAVLLCVAAAAIIRYIMHVIFVKTNPEKKRRRTILNLLFSATGYIFVILGFILILVSFNVDIVGIGATIGILTIVLGFGAQELIADVFAGLCMISENQFNIGDVIVADDFRGEVDNIGFRTTTVRDIGDNMKIFNNSDLRNIINCSAESSLAVCDVGISYDSDIEKVESAINTALGRVITKYRDKFTNIRNWGIESLSDYAIIIRVVGKTTEDFIYDARRIINKEILISLKENGIAIPTVEVQDSNYEG